VSASALPPPKSPWTAVLKFIKTEGLTRLSRDVCAWGAFLSLFLWMATNENLPQEVGAFFGASALSLGLGWFIFSHSLSEVEPRQR
jgi:uncharacterized membrane protein YhhN